jgi:hypothetical protein
MTREEYEAAAAAAERWPQRQGENWLRAGAPDEPKGDILGTADLGDSDAVAELLRADPALGEYG